MQIKMGGLECKILTFLGKHEHGVEEIGFLVDESDDLIGGEGQVNHTLLMFWTHLLDWQKTHTVEVRQHRWSSLKLRSSQKSKLTSMMISSSPRIQEFWTYAQLATGSEFPKLVQKPRLFERVKRAHRDSLRRSAVEIANAEYEREAQVAVEIPGPRRQPSARALHNLIHIPYRDWCQLCISTRARGDYQHSVADPEAALERDRPTIQVDFYFCEGNDERKTVSEAKAILLLVDVWTRYTHVEPMEKKSARAVGEEISRFAGMVGHVGMIELEGDNEHVLVAGMELCKSVGAKHGFPTTISLNKSYSKSRTGVAERTIQTVRNLQKTLVAQLEHEIQCKLPSPLLECSPCILALQQPVPHPFHYQSPAFSGGTWQTFPRSHHLLRAESFRIDGPWQQIEADVEAGGLAWPRWSRSRCDCNHASNYNQDQICEKDCS